MERKSSKSRENNTSNPMCVESRKNAEGNKTADNIDNCCHDGKSVDAALCSQYSQPKGSNKLNVLNKPKKSDKLVIDLNEIISALEMTTDQSQAYFDTKTGEILWQYQASAQFHQRSWKRMIGNAIFLFPTSTKSRNIT